jgi:hypothetical protein
MPPMEGNFNPSLEILWHGKGVAARGPLEWGDEKGGATLHVAIMQESGTAIGRSGDDVPHGANEFLIAAAVQGGGRLKPGPAIATGLALGRGSSVDMYQWSKPVTLTDGQPTAGLPEDLSPHKKKVGAHT